MGLDTVELVMDVEESFAITITDANAQDIITVGDLYEAVMSQTKLAPAGTCLSAATFYDVKRALRKLGIAERFGPSTRLDDILPRSDRRLFWLNLTNSLQLKLPRLERSNFVSSVNLAVTLLPSTALACLAAVNNDGSIETFVIAFVFLAIVLAVLTSMATQPLAIHFSSDVETFRGFSERVLALNATEQKSKHGPMGPNDVWVVLRDLIVDQLGCDRSEVVPEAQFVRDLGCG